MVKNTRWTRGRLKAITKQKLMKYIHISMFSFLCNDILLNDVKFLVVDKFYSNNLGSNLIEKLKLFPGVKNVKL